MPAIIPYFKCDYFHKCRQVYFVSKLYFIILVSAASLGEICTADVECSSMVNARCYRMYNCQTGECACKPGYGNKNGDGCESKFHTSIDQYFSDFEILLEYIRFGKATSLCIICISGVEAVVLGQTNLVFVNILSHL